MAPLISVIIVSFNTKDLLRRCLSLLYQFNKKLSLEVIVIDNDSKDGSQDMLKEEFPQVRLIESLVNLGFAAANNLGFRLSKGRYLIMLNSDAFVHEDSILKALEHMEKDKLIGLGGGRLMGKDGSWQPSARQFPSLLNDFLHLCGLSSKYPRSWFFGKADFTWDVSQSSRQCDWVPGAFAIISRAALKKVNYFDEKFFLYFEEVDLCKRICQAGYTIWYWSDVKITHLGGESSKTITHLSLSTSGSQLTSWRMRSQLIYYRKHYGWIGAFLSAKMEIYWNKMRIMKHKKKNSQESLLKIEDSKLHIKLMEQAWKETNGGAISPRTPW